VDISLPPNRRTYLYLDAIMKYIISLALLSVLATALPEPGPSPPAWTGTYTSKLPTHPGTPTPTPPAPSAAPAANPNAPVPVKTPSPTDIIPAAQCSGGPGKGQWSPFIVAHEGPLPSAMCPLDRDRGVFWFLDQEQVGCCIQNSYLTTAIRSQFACCPCGSTCAGLPPPMLQDWTFNGKL
jgi:hypothetical protein